MTEWYDEEIRLPHEFETEISCLVTENHQITMQGIKHSEDEMVEHMQKELAQEDYEVIQSEVSHVHYFYDGLRRSANHMSLVALVTRLEHWTRRFVKQLSLSTDKSRPPVTRDMEALNVRLGCSPISVDFFEELVTARDSVIHGDSQAEWEFKRPRRVAVRYAPPELGELNFTEQHLSEALEKTIKQVKWYDEQIAAHMLNRA